jgi:hypothetical protein
MARVHMKNLQRKIDKGAAYWISFCVFTAEKQNIYLLNFVVFSLKIRMDPKEDSSWIFLLSTIFKYNYVVLKSCCSCIVKVGAFFSAVAYTAAAYTSAFCMATELLAACRLSHVMLAACRD